MADSAHPGYSSTKASRGSPASAGEGRGGDVTAEPGQYPPAADHGIFGGPLPTGTGAPGSAGGAGDGDPTIEPGQTTDDFTGNSRGDLTSTGAPGSAGGDPSSGTGGNSVTFTRPGSYLSGTYSEDTVRDDIDGPGEWTEANDSGYATGGPQLPGIKGNQPTSTGAGRGRVMRGGRAVRG